MRCIINFYNTTEEAASDKNPMLLPDLLFWPQIWCFEHQIWFFQPRICHKQRIWLWRGGVDAIEETSQQEDDVADNERRWVRCKRDEPLRAAREWEERERDDSVRGRNDSGSAEREAEGKSWKTWRRVGGWVTTMSEEPPEIVGKEDK